MTKYNAKKTVIDGITFDSRKKVMLTEDQEQTLLFKWADLMAKQYPELLSMFAIPNGGKRNKITAMNLKRTGVKSGVPDIMLAIPKNGYSGLFIEMKRAKGAKVSPSQKEWIDRLTASGYGCSICKGYDEAVNVVMSYLKGAYK